MKATTWSRVLAVVLVLFATGHTLGTAAPRVRRGPSEAALFRAMQGFHFPVMGFDRTYWDFYRGFALTISLFLWLFFFTIPIVLAAVATFCATGLVVLLARDARMSGTVRIPGG